MKWSDLAIFKDPMFLNTFFLMSITYLYPHLGLFSFKNIGLAGLDDSWITISGIVGSLVNAVSRLIVGLCYNKFGYKACAFFIMFVEITSCLILVPSVGNKWAYMGSLSWFFITYGGQLGLYPLVADTLFHSKGAFSYTLLFSAFTLSSVIILFSEEFIKEKIGIENLLYGLAVANLIPIYSIIKIDRRIKKVNSEN
jgi:hypothetical protein